MKLISQIIIILVFGASFSQTGIIQYKITHIDLEQETIPGKIAINDEIKLMSFMLNYNESTSYFKKNKSVPIDESKASIAAILIKAHLDYFQDGNTKMVKYNQDIANSTFTVVDATKMKSWKLLSDQKQIDNYTCYKAILKHFNERSQKYYETIAWYCPSIPVPYGPVGYGGLPGLILELETSLGFVYSPENIVLNPSKLKIPDLIEGEEITPKKAGLLMRKARKVTED